MYKLWIRFAVAFAVMGSVNTSIAAPLSLEPAAMPAMATVDVRYQSYNIEMAEIVGGNFWKPYDQKNRQKSDKQNTVIPETGPTASAPARGGPPLQIGKGEMFQARAPIDLENARLRKLAAALGPAYVRVSGTWANSVYFHDSDSPPPAAPPKGFTSVLSRSEWKRVVDFAQAASAKIMTSFAISQGVRNVADIWTTDQ